MPLNRVHFSRRISGAYYNENDPYAAAWLRNLIAAGHIAPGDVDDRSILDVAEDDIRGYAQCHFFAGIGGWSLALRLANWADDRPVWTGSCPCQPLSGAGQRKGHADSRHLWPAFQRLIAERRPATVFGEQVASKDGREWLSGIRADLEGLGYAVGAADLCAASCGAPHIRQRLWWVASGLADADGERGGSRPCGDLEHLPVLHHQHRAGQGQDAGRYGGEGGGRPTDGGLGDPDDTGPQGRDVLRQRPGQRSARATGGIGGLADAQRSETRRAGEHPWGWNVSLDGSDAWLPCTDGKARRVEPGTFPLAHGVPNRVGRLRAYGNAIVPQVAAEFIRAYREVG